jgi:hypothetical protein
MNTQARMTSLKDELEAQANAARLGEQATAEVFETSEEGDAVSGEDKKVDKIKSKSKKSK